MSDEVEGYVEGEGGIFVREGKMAVRSEGGRCAEDEDALGDMTMMSLAVQVECSTARSLAVCTE